MSPDLEAIRARLDAAPGDWRVSDADPRRVVIDGEGGHACVVATCSKEEDAAAIVGLRADAAALLGEVERLTGELQWYADEIDRACAEVRGTCVCTRAERALDEVAARLAKALAAGKVSVLP